MNKSDFIFTFESKGTTLLFEDIVIRNYWFGEAIALYNEGRIRDYVSKATVKEFNRDGENRTSIETQYTVDSLRNHTNLINKKIRAFKTKTPLTIEDIQEVFRMLGGICRHYAYFDIHHWDSAYVKSKNNQKTQENIIL